MTDTVAGHDGVGAKGHPFRRLVSVLIASHRDIPPCQAAGLPARLAAAYSECHDRLGVIEAP
jgi:hypothetical protein